MNVISQLLRRILTHFGYEATQASVPTLRLEEFLRLSKEQLTSETAVHVFDDDPRTIRRLIGAFQERHTHVHSLGLHGSPFDSTYSPNEHFWITINIERVALQTSLANEAWFKAADVLIICGSLGAFNSGTCDFTAITRKCSEAGLELLDVAAANQPVAFNCAQNQLYLIFAPPRFFERYKENFSRRVRRVDEARAFLPVPAAQRATFRWLTESGSFGHKGGVFNPGAIADDSGSLLLMRGESDLWNAQKKSEARHFSSWKLELVNIDSENETTGHKTLHFSSPFPKDTFRVEDCRLFKVGDKVFSNHAVITLPSDRMALDQPLELESRVSRMGLSYLSGTTPELQFKGFPTIDIPTRRIEKNWAMFSLGADVYLIYSLSPYRILRANAWPELSFSTVVNRDLLFSFAQPNSMIRNSTNPVEYDEHHLLHIVHAVHPSKQYVFWALLIEKDGLLPRFACDIPIARAGRSVPGSIVYLCSVIAQSTRILLFAGINDCSSGVWEIKRSLLDSRWRPLPLQ